MARPRVTLGTLMAVVFVVAVNLAGADLFFGTSGLEWPDLVNFGARPMVSILAVGLVSLLTPRTPEAATRPFLAGFELCGLAATFLYLACAAIFTRQIHEGVGDCLKQVFSPAMPFYGWALMAVLLLPQVLIALLGGWMNKRYRFRLRLEVARRAI
jgi:hypothetical protein